MPPIQTALAEAVRLHQAGRLDDAERAYDALLAKKPDQPDALNLLGLIALQRGEPAAAERLIGQALNAAPHRPDLLCNLGTAMLEQGKAAEAIARFREAIGRDPRHVDAHYNLGNALRQTSEPSGAAEHYRRAVALVPRHLPARNNLALCQADAGQLPDAIATLEAALAIDPADAQTNANLAAALAKAGRPAEALARYDQALLRRPRERELLIGKGSVEIDVWRFEDAAATLRLARSIAPDDVRIFLLLGSLCRRQGRPAEAEAHYRAALAREPGSATAHGWLALSLSEMFRHDEALTEVERALALRPEHAESWANRALVLKNAGRDEESIAAYGKAAVLDGRSSAPHRAHRGLQLLLLGRFGDGWRDYHARESVRDGGGHYRAEPLPRDLAGLHVVVEREQGLGDELFFLRFAPMLRARGARVTYLADPRLAAMLTRARIVDRVLPQTEGPETADLHALVGDLPFLLDIAEGDGPPAAFAIPPLPDRTAALAARLAAFGPPPYVGVSWRAGTQDQLRLLFKEAPATALGRALRGLNATPVMVQRLPRIAELEAFQAALGRPALDLTASNSDLEDMLALTGLLEDHVCVSNTNVHLAAARGRTCRILVPHPPEFRWMAGGAESPWFPGMRVYRQTADGDWDGALARLGADLAAAFAPR